jgi:hypothetical protein
MATFATLPLALSRLIDPSPTASHRPLLACSDDDELRVFSPTTVTAYCRVVTGSCGSFTSTFPVDDKRLAGAVSADTYGPRPVVQRPAQPIRQHPIGRIPMHTHSPDLLTVRRAVPGSRPAFSARGHNRGASSLQEYVLVRPRS